MDSKELRNLHEAYLDVYENEQLDEIDSSIIARTAHKRMQNLDAAQKKEMGARDVGASAEEQRKRGAETSAAAAKVSKHRALSTAHARSRSRMNKEEVDIFDTILEYLVTEGYADTNESALVIMANMSEEWRQSIVEAEVANRNPDEYERKAKQGQSREQQLKGRVMGRMSQMDPDKKAAMLKQMRAVGLDV